MGLLLGQVSKWRAQRADGGVHAARGFVRGAAHINDCMEMCFKRFQCRTRLFPFAPTTASRSPSPARAGEAWLRSVFSQNHAILASPADAGERSTSANHTSFYSCSWDVFPYDLFPVQLCPMGLLLGQVSKWRAQRADRGAHVARGFVRGAACHGIVIKDGSEEFQCRTRLCGWCSLQEESGQCRSVLFQCRTRLCGWCSNEEVNAHVAPTRFNAARGFVGGATLMEPLWEFSSSMFQCRTRLCGWCNQSPTAFPTFARSFNAARGFVGGATFNYNISTSSICSFNAARGFVGGATNKNGKNNIYCVRFNAARGFVGGATWLSPSKGRNRLEFQCRTRLCGWCNVTKIGVIPRSGLSFNAARGFVGGATNAPHFAEWSEHCFNAARGFVGGATVSYSNGIVYDYVFQCRTRLCGWCNHEEDH